MSQSWDNAASIRSYRCVLAYLVFFGKIVASLETTDIHKKIGPKCMRMYSERWRGRGRERERGRKRERERGGGEQQ